MHKSMLVAAALAALVCSTSASSATFASESSSFAECTVGMQSEALSAVGESRAVGPGLSVPGYTVSEAKSAVQRQMEMDSLHAQLVGEAAPMAKGTGVRVQLDRQELFSIGEGDCPECAALKADERRFQVGVAKPVNLAFDMGGFRGRSYMGAFASGALAPAAEGGFVWTTSISSQGAHALRVVFAGLDLPQDAELYVYNAAGEAFGPYTGRGMYDSGTLVSNTVTGDTVNVQLRYYGNPKASDLARTRFTIAEVGHIGSRFILAAKVNPKVAVGAKAFCSYNATCVTNGECATSSTWGAIDSVRKGVAHMLFQSGQGFYICSGGLLNNTANDGRALFLTANHCISTQSEAGSLETFWDFRAASCSNTAACDFSYAEMRSLYPTTLGATSIAHGTSGDYSLMELSSVPGGTRTYLGYSTTAVSGTSGFDLFRLSHPKGAPQAFSRQDVNTTAGTCQTLPRGAFIYSTDSSGATEGGSSGSPVLNTAGQVVGQLYGACGTNLNNVCDSASNRTVDGAMASYYPNVSAYLNPSGGGGGTVAHVGNIVLTRVTMNGNRTRGQATVTVLNASNQPVSGATVSGQFSGFYAGGASGTTNASGVAVLQSAPKKGSGTVSFCVNGISGTNITYNSGANTETCDNF